MLEYIPYLSIKYNTIQDNRKHCMNMYIMYTYIRVCVQYIIHPYMPACVKMMQMSDDVTEHNTPKQNHKIQYMYIHIYI